MRKPTGLFVAAILAATCSVVGCAGGRQYLGDVSLRAYTNIGGSPQTWGVEEGRIVDSNLDVAIDSDGCARGSWGRNNYVLCPREVAADRNQPEESAKRWFDQGGDFVTRVSADGSTLRVDGTLLTQRSYQLQLHVTLRFGKGPQWDELRKYPVLYAVAAASIGMTGEPPAQISPPPPPGSEATAPPPGASNGNGDSRAASALAVR